MSVPEIADTAGGAGATFGENYDNYQNTIDSRYVLRIPGISVDQLIETFELQFPTHIKMDIDGIQDKVIRGAHHTLRDPRLRSVMLELNPRDNEINTAIYDFIRGEMEDAGFRLDKIVRTAPSGTDDPERGPTNQFFSRP